MPDAVMTPEAPAITPESVPAGVGDATGGYESFEFDYPEATPAPDGKRADATPAPAAHLQEPDDLPDEELDRVLKHPKGQTRLDQLVNNRYGNQLQQARQEAQRAREQAVREFQQEQQKRAEAATFYQKLSNDDAFFDDQVAKYGRPAVLHWMGDYETAIEAENQGTPAADIERIQRDYGTAFNAQAIDEFRTIAKATLPFYGDLPDDTRAVFEKLAYDPAGNWLADAMTALASGVQKHIDGLERRHKEALDQARQAGKNEAIASREEASPVVVAPSSGTGGHSTWKEAERAYAEGRIDRSEFLREKARFRVTY